MDYQLIKAMCPGQILTPVEQILLNRGIPVAYVKHYLNTNDFDIIDPVPYLGEYLKQGAQMLIQHISENHRIMIQIDSDCDGYTSAAHLINYLYCLFPAFVQNNICYRIHTGKQHGIILETIPEDVKLVIAPDSSSNDYEEHKILNERGVDVLVIDHHEADKWSEHACVINNQLSSYPTKSLSGVGMVYKFCSYIDRILGINYADQFLDLVALGIDYTVRIYLFSFINEGQFLLIG